MAKNNKILLQLIIWFNYSMKILFNLSGYQILWRIHSVGEALQ